MCDSNSKPKFKAGDKVLTLCGEFEVLLLGNISYSGKQIYICYKEGFRGHSAKSTIGSDIFENTKYKGQCWNFIEDELELVVKENCKQTPKNYRELTPDTLIDISIDGNEFKVPLGDLVHTEHLLGKSTGAYGYTLWSKIHEIIDRDNTLLNSDVYPKNTAPSELQSDLFKIYFIDKEKEAKLLAKKQALKESIDKKLEEISKLAKELNSLDES